MDAWYTKNLCLIGFIIFFIEIECSPIVNNEKFVDEWDYKINPHSIPLLNDLTRNHVLPSTEQTSKEITPPVERSHSRAAKALIDPVRSRVSCGTCKIGVQLLLKEIDKGTPQKDIEVKFVGLCTALRIVPEHICRGIFNVYGEHVIVSFGKASIGKLEICSMLLGEPCGDVDNFLHEWEVELPDIPKPNVEELPLPKESLPTFKVLQISDTHYDPDYEEGSISNCQEPLCCRNYSTPTPNEEVILAGKWSSYKKCDSPRILIENMLKHISEQHPDIDYIIWTGDLPPHDIWNQTKRSNMDIIEDTVRLMFEYFPGTPVFPALGNHESVPPGSFPPPWVEKKYSVSWLYNHMADQWRRWLPASVGNTLLHGGFYSVLIRPGFRLISLNMNYCHSINSWLFVNSTDPAKELQWLIFELQEAENKGEKVHIIGHIPPGSDDCIKVWSENFNRIVERYENTIVAQFYGHTHADEFEVLYDTVESSRPINIAYLAPSVTTYENHNPAYRIYYVDGDHNETTREIIDHETWTFNLDEANKDSEPNWYLLYTAKSAYDLESLRPKEWSRLIDRMVEDPALFQLFYKHYYRNSPTSPNCDNAQCIVQILCDLRSGRSRVKRIICEDLKLAFGR